MARSAPLMIGVTATVALFVGGTVWLLARGDDGPPPAQPVDVATAPTEEGPTEVVPLPVHPSMPGVFPWTDFQAEFDLLMRPVIDEPTAQTDFQTPEAFTANTLAEKKLTIRLSQATVNEIVDEIARQTEDTGVKVYTREPYFSDTMRYDVHQTDKNIWQILAFLEDSSNRMIKKHLGDNEVCIGTTLATMRAREDAKRKAARKRARKDADSGLLDATFRPDFDRADAEKVVRAMTAQTEVQILLHPLVWEKHLAVTWRGKEMELHKALDHLTRKLDAVFRVHEGRVYILPAQ